MPALPCRQCPLPLRPACRRPQTAAEGLAWLESAGTAAQERSQRAGGLLMNMLASEDESSPIPSLFILETGSVSSSNGFPLLVETEQSSASGIARPPFPDGSVIPTLANGVAPSPYP
mmetsp:Transcript_38538/g.91380  ORF Transcript_38538/g.91380 Transcript_38538/m.91380 type:complete len:117 (+) Transcript_38538:367-717(+)